MAKLTSIILVDSGYGYVTPPTITVDLPDPDSANASFTANITAGRVSSLNLINAGRYYITAPTVTVSGGNPDSAAVITASIDSADGGSISLSIQDSGSGYASAPTILIDSANGTKADYRATAVAVLGDSGVVTAINITDSGGGYTLGTFPTISITAPPVPDVRPGDSASQTLSSGIIVTGEIAKYSDSDGVIHLVNVGSNDSSFHSFVGSGNISFGNGAARRTRRVLSAVEDNKLASNEQNLDFDGFEASFLDFSESNPFGDPS